MYDYDRSGLTVAGLKAKWTEKDDSWVSRAEYANGDVHTWTIARTFDDGYAARVKTPKGTFETKKLFDTLAQAQNFAGKFIQKANGAELLAGVLSKDFFPKKS